MGNTITKLKLKIKKTKLQPLKRTSNDRNVDENNGLDLNGYFIPFEIMQLILSHVDPKHLLICMLVCKLWNDLIKSEYLWHYVCVRHNMEPKHLPWYLYYVKFATDFFDTNIINIGNYCHFDSKGLYVATELQHYLPLPAFHGLVTTGGDWRMSQIVVLRTSRIRAYILERYQPTILYDKYCGFILMMCVGDKTSIETGTLEGGKEQWKQVILEVENYEIGSHPFSYYLDCLCDREPPEASLEILFDSITEPIRTI